VRATGLLLGWTLTHEEAEALRESLGVALAGHGRLDALVERRPPVPAARAPGHRPSREEDPFNAWYWRCSVREADEGRLAGTRVGVKDAIGVAGMPLSGGIAALDGYLAEADATVVTRILAAGGEIVGTTTYVRPGEERSAVRNPRDPERTAGGSSGGSAAAVAAGDCELALGIDQGGSIRIPAAWCGLCGLKPTFGLVPYSGCFPMELTLDTIGPMAATVEEVATALEVLAGPDGLDPRQDGVAPLPATDLRSRVDGLRVGVLAEGFGAGDPEVDAVARRAVDVLASLGHPVSEVSVPLHADGIHIWSAIEVEGAGALIAGAPTNVRGEFPLELYEAFLRASSARPDALPTLVKVRALAARYLQERYRGLYYGRAQNLARELRTAYDGVLGAVDLLVMPTVPIVAPELNRPDGPGWENDRAVIMRNTSPFSIAGLPALTLPCGEVRGLPVGLTVVGRWSHDHLVLRAAYSLEQALLSAAELVR
jgi:amidase